MRFVFLFTYCLFSFIAQAQLFTGGCTSYIDHPVTLEIAQARSGRSLTGSDSSCPPEWGIRCFAGVSAGYYLRPADTAFRIISFVINGEAGGGDILEANCTGSNLSGHCMLAYNQLLAGTDIYFYCIRAVHANGKEYTLKPFSVER